MELDEDDTGKDSIWIALTPKEIAEEIEEMDTDDAVDAIANELDPKTDSGSGYRTNRR